MTVINTDSTVQSEIVINAPAEKIFAAMTDPQQLPQWWGGEGCEYHIDRFDSDLRVGGIWRSTGCDASGKPFTVEGVYRTIQPPHVLEYTWNYSWATEKQETLVRFDLITQGSSTLVRVTHSGFVDAESRDNHKTGWGRVLGWLAAYAA